LLFLSSFFLKKYRNPPDIDENVANQKPIPRRGYSVFINHKLLPISLPLRNRAVSLNKQATKRMDIIKINEIRKNLLKFSITSKPS